MFVLALHGRLPPEVCREYPELFVYLTFIAAWPMFVYLAIRKGL